MAIFPSIKSTHRYTGTQVHGSLQQNTNESFVAAKSYFYTAIRNMGDLPVSQDRVAL